jgi:hypothetical protein
MSPLYRTRRSVVINEGLEVHESCLLLERPLVDSHKHPWILLHSNNTSLRLLALGIDGDI